MADKSDYTPEILEKAKEYLNSVEGEDANIPTIESLALYIGKARSTIYKWLNEEDKKEFSDITERVLALQAEALINKGLKNEFNSTITKLMLGKHGYRDTSETDVTSGGKPLYLPMEILEKNGIITNDN